MREAFFASLIDSNAGIILTKEAAGLFDKLLKMISKEGFFLL
jgi:hypothetical protein